MGDRRQMTGDKCGVVTQAGRAGDKNRLGYRSDDTWDFRTQRLDRSTRVWNSGVVALRFGIAIGAIAARGAALECDHGCGLAQRSRTSQRSHLPGSTRMITGASQARRLRTGRQRIFRLGGPKAGSKGTIRCASKPHWPHGSCQAFQGLMGGLMGGARKCSKKALRAPMSDLWRYFVGLILLNVAGKAF